MIKKAQMLITHPLISGSTIIVVGTNISNFFNLLFTFFMLRNLTPSDYGILVSLVSIFGLFGLLADSFAPVIVNFSASYFANKQLEMVKGIFFHILKTSSIIGFLILLFFIIFSRYLGDFLKIYDVYLIILVGVCIFIAFVTVVNRALLQAKLSFTFLSVSGIIATLAKLITGVILVFIGFRVFGAVTAFLFSLIFGYLLSFFPLNFLLNKSIKSHPIDVKKLIDFGLPAALSLLGITAFITTDILLVKHFFDPNTAGLYAGLAVVSKIIFYFSSPIGTVMFPLIVHKRAQNLNYNTDFKLALVLVLLPSFAFTVLYFLFPDMIISLVMKHKEYLAGSSLLGPLGIFVMMYSLLSIVTNFYLSIQKTNVYIPITVFASIQAVLIWFYHRTLFQIIIISNITIGLLLVFLLLYYWTVIARKNDH